MRMVHPLMGRALLLVLGIFCFVLFFGGNEVVLAEQTSNANDADTTLTNKEKIFLQADGQVLFDADEGDVYAEGNVVLIYEDIIIRSHEAYYDSQEKKVYMVGDVEYEREDQLIRGASLVYDLSTMTSVFDSVHFSFSSKGMHGLAYAAGQQVTQTEEFIHIEDGTVTTCDLETPHYHLKSNSIEIYPDEKIVVRDVVYYEGKIPLFYWPYLVIPIRTAGDGETSVFEMPRIGHSESEGWYVKSAYNYYRNVESYGKVHLDWFEKKGWGKGVRHTYQDDALGVGSILLYHLSGNRDWGESVAVEIDQKVTLDWIEVDAVVSRESRQNYSEETVDHAADVKVSGSTTNSSLKGYLDYTNSETDLLGTKSLDLATQIDYSYELSNQWKINLGGDVRKVGTQDSVDTQIGYLTELAHRQQMYEAGIKLERKLHSDVFSSKWPTSVEWVSVSALPEIYWRSRNWTWFDGWLPMRFSSSFSQLSEEYRDDSKTQADKFSLVGGTRTKAISLTPKTRLTFSGWVQYDLYSDVDTFDLSSGTSLRNNLASMERTVLSSRTGLHYKPWQPLTFSVGYNYDGIMGETPFVTDEIDPREEITGRIQYHKGGLTASVSSGYDLASQEYNDVVGRVGYIANDKLDATIQAVYDVEQAAIDDIYTLVKARPLEGWELQLGSSYSFPTETWERLDARAMAQLPWGLSVQYLISYDGVSETLSYNDIAITKDLHCREITLRYSGVSDEIWLEFSLNAFPRTKLLAGTSDDELLFEAEGIQELITLVE